MWFASVCLAESNQTFLVEANILLFSDPEVHATILERDNLLLITGQVAELITA